MHSVVEGVIRSLGLVLFWKAAACVANLVCPPNEPVLNAYARNCVFATSCLGTVILVPPEAAAAAMGYGVLIGASVFAASAHARSFLKTSKIRVENGNDTNV